ncbi:fasciclin domain-containing protein [Nocardioides taihuensis]|uniref:Fasciclin domain-containing protein n=1 Tax=Nocardioides taihuensis TaxID=1835606 RepID=A0ABW0BGU6_9ACTN
MNRTTRFTRTTALGLGAALAASAFAGLSATSATAAPAAKAPGTTSLAEVLDADGNKFDKEHGDFDIVDRAVRTVLGAKPDSPVGVLADGNTRVTAFIPTDKAFMRLVKDVAGSMPETEKATFDAVATFGVDTIEAVLLYHVVAGDTINSKEAAGADGAELTMASGGIVTVNVTDGGSIKLQDADTDDTNAKVIPAKVDINKGNKQIAHGISRVLRPINL